MKVAIIGHGRFGTLLKSILQTQYNVNIFDKADPLETLKQFDTVFLCVPIRNFSAAIQKIAPHLKPTATVIDTCSVKLHPVECMQQFLPNSIDIIATHPLFGPDSYNQQGPHNMMMDNIRCNNKTYTQWKQFFASQPIHILEMTADEHDRFAARSQGITHLLGRTLESMQISSTPIDTLGFTRLLGIVNQTCNDSHELFEDLQTYNPYSKATLKQLLQTLESQMEILH